MRRTTDSSRSRKWLERNSLKNNKCREYVESLCNSFEFTQYAVKEFGLTGTLWITHNGKSYIAGASPLEIGVVVSEDNSKSSKHRYHKLEKVFYGDTSWYECLSWIKNQ